MQKEFLESISCKKSKESKCKFLLYLLSPVILNVKPAMTISLKKDCEKLLKNIILSNINLKYTYLYVNKSKRTILVYNRKNLKKELEESKSEIYLENFGYKRSLSIEEKINILKNKYKGNNFPHEIGAFLGIPFKDIVGFIENGKCLYTGYWKVYSDLEYAKKKFNLYDRSKEIMLKKFDKEESIAKIVKSVNLLSIGNNMNC